MKNTQITLRGSTALFALVLAGGMAATPAFAQTTPTPSTTAPATTQDTTSQDEGTIVVTGSMFQSAAGAATPSPVTVVTAENLDKRGISTVQDAIQSARFEQRPGADQQLLGQRRVRGRRIGRVAARPVDQLDAGAVRRPARRLLPARRRRFA
jgi:alkylation response protein AidB-like acyl-CoA dehydrogenase